MTGGRGQLDDAFAAAAPPDRPRVIVVRTDPDVLSPAAALSGLLAEHAGQAATAG